MMWKEQSLKKDTNLCLNHYFRAGINLFCRHFAHHIVQDLALQLKMTIAGHQLKIVKAEAL